MAGDKAEDGGRPKKVVADLADLREHLDAEPFTDGAAFKEALAGLDLTYGGAGKVVSDFAFAQAEFERMAAATLGPSYSDMQERMDALTGMYEERSALAGVAKQIAEQQRAIDALHPLHLPDHLIDREHFDVLDRLESPGGLEHRFPEIPLNPIHETNERLERIEHRFEQMQDIALNSAKITTGLQASAAELQGSVNTFLNEFKAAAVTSDVSTRRAFRISTGLAIVALVIAVATPIVQAVIDGPDKDPALQAAVEGLRAELTALTEAQNTASDGLSEALTVGDQDAATVLQDIRDLLSVPPTADPEDPASATKGQP